MVFPTLWHSHPVHRNLRSFLFFGVRNSSRHASRQAGFSLIELLVVTGVIAVISGLMLVSNSTFGGQILLQNLAYDIALTLRQAQVYGISVQRFGTSYGSSYGMHFDKDSIVYPLFADAVNPNGIYNPDAAHPTDPLYDETVKTTTIGGGFRITSLCAVLVGASPPTCTSINSLDIVFKRPDPDACIAINGVSSISSPGGVCTSTYTSARITVLAPRGNKSSIVVYKNGQISVEKGK